MWAKALIPIKHPSAPLQIFHREHPMWKNHEGNFKGFFFFTFWGCSAKFREFRDLCGIFFAFLQIISTLVASFHHKNLHQLSQFSLSLLYAPHFFYFPWKTTEFYEIFPATLSVAPFNIFAGRRYIDDLIEIFQVNNSHIFPPHFTHQRRLFIN